MGWVTSREEQMAKPIQQKPTANARFSYDLC
jgi:hypothetical protein